MATNKSNLDLLLSEASLSKGYGLFLRRSAGNKHLLFYHCQPGSSGAIDIYIDRHTIFVLPLKTKRCPKTYHRIIASTCTWSVLTNNWEAVHAAPVLSECEDIALSPSWKVEFVPSSGDFPNDDDLFTSGQIPAEKTVQSFTDQSIDEVLLHDSPPPRPSTPISPHAFVQNVMECSTQPAAPKNLLDAIPSFPTVAVATDTPVHCLSRLIADYNVIHHARQRHALLLADGRPPLVPLPRAFQVPAMHLIATEDLNNKLNATMTKCARELSTLLINAEEQALENILAEVADTLVEWTPDKEQLKAIVNYKNLRTKNLTEYKDGGGPIEYYQLVNSNGRPTIQPSSAPSKLHTAAHRNPKRKDQPVQPAPGQPPTHLASSSAPTTTPLAQPVAPPAQPVTPLAQPVNPPTKPKKPKRKKGLPKPVQEPAVPVVKQNNPPKKKAASAPPTNKRPVNGTGSKPKKLNRSANVQQRSVSPPRRQRQRPPADLPDRYHYHRSPESYYRRRPHTDHYRSNRDYGHRGRSLFYDEDRFYPDRRY